MSSRVDYQRCQNADEAFKIVKERLTPDVVAQFHVTADFEYNEPKKEILVSGKGFELNMNFLEEMMNVDLNISSFLLKPMRGTILSKVEKMLGSVL